jgi:hypothetical protein
VTSIAPIPHDGRLDRAGESRRAPRRSAFLPPTAAGATLLATGLVLLMTLGSSVAQSPHTASWSVLAIDQSNYTTEQSNFTVSVEVASPASVTLAYFTFCQLSSPVCYIPVTMTLHGGNWFEGTTNRMESYDGMAVGVRAGYNITIDYANNTNITEPSLPNAFPSLTVATEVGGEYMYEMSVGNQLYGLSGQVSQASTHASIAGATVSLTPGNGTTATTSSTGAYSFSGLANGTYTVSVVSAGYPTTNVTVTIAGQNFVKDIPLSTSSTTPQPTPAPSKSNGTFGFLTTTTGLVLLGVVAALLVVGVVWASLRAWKPKGEPPNSGGSTSTPPANEPPR